MIPDRRPKGPFGLIDKVHDIQSRLARVWGRPTEAILSDLVHDGCPVVLFRNPKTAGKSLKQFLRVKHYTHAFPRERLSEKSWLGTYSIVVVRDPFERFLSGYYNHIHKQRDNGLVKIYGPSFKSFTAFQYLEVLADLPRFGGLQTNWTDFPSHRKPRADLVLRFEDLPQWKARMIEAGLPVENRDFPHLNRSSRADADHLQALNMTQDEFGALRAAVRKHFDADYRSFGY
jgi:Sulfotransferase family